MLFLKKPHNQKLFLGIDLGTTYSLVAMLKDKKIIFLKDQKERYLFPSIVHYKKEQFSVGWKAQKNIISDNVNTISSIKRLIGRSIEFVKNKFPILPYLIETNKNNEIVFHTNYGVLTPSEITSHILQDLKKRTEIFFDKKIDASIITVPAYFNHIQRTEIKKSAFLAKINVVKLLNEPTAAAIAYGLQEKKQGIIIVYDLGGGTFDLSILKLNKGIFEVLGTSGDSHLGGDDFDLFLADYIYKKAKFLHKNEKQFASKLLQIAKDIKLRLTDNFKVKVNFLNWTGYITRDEFNASIFHLIQKTLSICSNLLKDTEVSINDIQEIVMVGGSTRVPLVYKEVSKFFQKHVLQSIHPEKVVAIGAAIQSNMIMSENIQNKTLLLDVIPLSLGIEVMGGLVEKIIFRNTKIPISNTKEFTTFKNNQTTILIHVLQGENELVQGCTSLSRFILKDIPPKAAGIVRILVTFQIDSDGLIHVKAREKNSNQEKIIQIDNSIFYQ